MNNLTTDQRPKMYTSTTPQQSQQAAQRTLDNQDMQDEYLSTLIATLDIINNYTTMLAHSGEEDYDAKH
jgi:hypothetical protein